MNESKIKVPLPTTDDVANGWTINYAYLQRLQDYMKLGDDAPSLEHIQSTLLAAIYVQTSNRTRTEHAAIGALERDAREDARDAATEAMWKERQGDDYGSY